LEIAERLRHLARVASGPDASFEHQQEIAAAVVAEVLAGLWKDDPEPAAGTSERGEGG
jgi:xanthine/CO dehydrogenase XdhC/CoxF family maturation factor